VRKAGQTFDLVKTGEPASSRAEQVLLRSVTTGWFGWLPLHEIKIQSDGEQND
jgi:hypothetical protein